MAAGSWHPSWENRNEGWNLVMMSYLFFRSQSKSNKIQLSWQNKKLSESAVTNSFHDLTNNKPNQKSIVSHFFWQDQRTKRKDVMFMLGCVYKVPWPKDQNLNIIFIILICTGPWNQNSESFTKFFFVHWTKWPIWVRDVSFIPCCVFITGPKYQN